MLVCLLVYWRFITAKKSMALTMSVTIFREDEYLINMQHTVIPSWYQREGYIKAMADLIEKELQKFDCPEEVIMFLQMHI